jgi:hypothetical protein
MTSCSNIIRMLMNTHVDVVGMNKENMGHQCELHECCSNKVQVTTKVKIVKKRMVYRDRGE